jgi:hypothetical protein
MELELPPVAQTEGEVFRSKRSSQQEHEPALSVTRASHLFAAKAVRYDTAFSM